MTKKVLLQDVATLLNGRAYKQDELLGEGKYPVLRVGNFFSNKDWYFSDLELDEDKYCDNGDLLFAWSASFGPKIWDGGKAIYHYHIWKIITKPEIEKRYFYYFLESAAERIKNSGHGIAMVHTTKGDMEKMELLLPEMEQQLHIATILDKVSNLISLRKQQLAKLDEMVKARFVELFGDPVTNEKGWPRLTLGDICEIGSSKRVFEKDYVSKGIPFFRTKEIVELSKGNQISTELFIAEEHYEELKKSFGVPKKDDLLISAVGTIGTIWIVNGDFEFYFKDGNLIQIKASPNFSSIFMKYLLNELIANYKKEMSTGTAYSALTIAGLKKMLVYDVPLDLQNQFAAFVKQTDKSKLTVQQSLNKLEVLKKALMQKYFG